MSDDHFRRRLSLESVVPHPLSHQELRDPAKDLPTALACELSIHVDQLLVLYRAVSPDDNTLTVLKSFLGALSENGALAFMTDIKTIGRDDARLRDFSNYLIGTLLKPIQSAVALSTVASRPMSPNRDIAEPIAQHADGPESSDRHLQAALKSDCLQRDGYRCVYSHIPDRECAGLGLVSSKGARNTKLCHIIPLALANFEGGGYREREAVANIWFALWRYFPVLVDQIGPYDLNQHRNLVTLNSTAGCIFVNYSLAFAPLSKQENTYGISNFVPFKWDPEPAPGHQTIMSLKSSDGRFPLPNPDFFTVHEQLSRILDLGGIGRQIRRDISDSLGHDLEELNPDGSTDLGAILRRRLGLSIREARDNGDKGR